MPGEYVLEGLAIPETLSNLHELLERVGTEHPGLADEDLSMLETAVIEVAGNVVEHGRPEGKVVYRFRLAVLPERVEAHLEDAGQEVAGDPGAPALPDPLAEHGRGLALTRAVLDEFSYGRVDGTNVWHLVRYRR
jgi:serine/threonine-protein kinase RsbW